MSRLPDQIDCGNGTVLSLGELDPGDLLDLIEAGGSAMAGASAGAWLNYAQMICSVRAINRVPVQMPATKNEIRELARKIGNEGVSALHPLFFSDDKQLDNTVDTAKN